MILTFFFFRNVTKQSCAKATTLRQWLKSSLQRGGCSLIVRERVQGVNPYPVQKQIHGAIVLVARGFFLMRLKTR